MALTPEQIYGLRVRSGMDAFRPMKEHWQAKDDDAAYRFARAIEAEVRKDDEVLIRQLTDLVQAQHDYIMALPADVVASLPAMPGFDGDWADTIKAAARARLEGKSNE